MLQIDDSMKDPIDLGCSRMRQREMSGNFVSLTASKKVSSRYFDR